MHENKYRSFFRKEENVTRTMGQIKNKLQMIYLSPNINILTLDESGLKTPIKGRDCQTGKKKARLLCIVYR